MDPVNSIETILKEGKAKWSLFSESFEQTRKRGENNKEEAHRIMTVIRQAGLPFPLTVFFMEEESVRAGFRNLTAYAGKWIERSHESIKGHSGKFWLPSLFRGRARQFVTRSIDWWQVDVIVDWFTEYERIRAKKDYTESPYESWHDDKTLIKILLSCSRKGQLTCSVVRDAVYYSGRELGLFRCTRAKSLVEEIFSSKDLRAKRWLDMSAGWGDRLLTACALGMDYLGFDPNVNLEYGHSKMIKMFGTDRQRVHYRPFQTRASMMLIEQEVIDRGKFDLSLISPPFYTIERYRGEGQSTETYPELDDWIVKFLFKSLFIIWCNLKDGGYLAINMGNIRDCDIIGPMQLFIEDILPGCHWEGILTFSGKGAQEVTGITYVWRKADDQSKDLWNPKIKRSLKTLFPVLWSLWTEEMDRDDETERGLDSVDEKKTTQNSSN